MQKGGEAVIYNNIKELADKRGYSIRELERLSGLKNGAIGKWRKVSPRVNNLQNVADILGVTVNRLLKE